MADRQKQRLDTSVAVTDHIDRPLPQMIHQGREIIGHQFIGHRTGTVGRLPMVPAVHGDHQVVLAEFVQLEPQFRDSFPVSGNLEPAGPLA